MADSRSPSAPELNPQENIWQFMRQNWLSNRIFKSFDDILDHCCYAWNTLLAQPWKIMAIARRDVTGAHPRGSLIFWLPPTRASTIRSWHAITYRSVRSATRRA